MDYCVGIIIASKEKNAIISNIGREHMEANQNQDVNEAHNEQYRINTQLHESLMKAGKRSALQTNGELLTLPEPVFPQRPPGEDYTDKQYNNLNAVRGLISAGWACSR